MPSILASITVAFVLLGCAVDQSTGSVTEVSFPDWMARIPDGRSLAELSIPGTHESLAITGGEDTQCQDDNGASAETLAVQLNAGVRMFDIRCRITDGNKFTIHHGAEYQNANFDDVLVKIESFLSAHSSETVLLRIKSECTGDFGSCKDADGDFEGVFRGYVDARRSLFWGPAVEGGGSDVPKMGEVRGKIVLVVLNGRLGGRFSSWGLAQFADWKDKSSTYVQDEYAVTEINTKIGQILRFLDKTNSGDKTKIYVNFNSGSTFFIMPPDAVAWGVYPSVLAYLKETPLTRTGAMMIDFIQGDMIRQIISMNNWWSC